MEVEGVKAIESFIKEFIKNQINLDDKTKKQKEIALSYLVDFMKTKGINFIFDINLISEYVLFLRNKGHSKFKERTYKDSTIKVYLYYVKEFVDYMRSKGFNARYDEKAERTIFKGRRANRKKEIEFLTEVEFIKLLNYVKSNKPPIYYLLLIVLYYTGLRISEALSLRPEDFYVMEEVDEETGEIKQLWYVKVKDGKFGKEREVPILFIPERFLKDLLAWVKVKKELNQPVFSYMDNYTKRFVDFSKKHGRQNVDKMLKKLKEEFLEEVGFDENRTFSAHVFRKSYTTRLAEKGVSLEDLQRWLGHSDIRTTERIYRAVTERMKRKRDFSYL